jgi:hypothetical protein
MEKQPQYKDTLLKSIKPEDISDEYHVHSSTIKRHVRKLFPQKSYLQACRHAIVSDAVAHYIELRIITDHPTIEKELFRELSKFGYSLTYRSGVNALRSINFHPELKKKRRHF